MLPLLEEIHTIRARTHEAGLADAMSVINAGVDVDRARVEIERQRLELEQRLTNLSFYTGEAYSSAAVELAPLPEPEEPLPGFDPARHPLIRSYDHEIAKKEAEIGAIRRSVLPTLTGYTRYSWYGTDASSFDRAREGVHERGYSLGLYATLPISEGFRTLHTLRRAELEAARLRTERTKALAELQRYFQSIELELHHLERDVAAKRATLAKVEHEAELISRLLAEQSVDRERYVEQRASVIEARLLLSLSMNNCRRASALVWHHVFTLRHTLRDELT
jgi:outer membrane protein TolC